METEDVSGFDPKRRLCTDGTCTGIIGADGRCGECGRPAANANDSVRAGKTETENQAVDIFAVLDAADEGKAAASGTSDPGTATVVGSTGFDPNRRLCEDGTCVGIIGPTGACTVCGRVAG